LPTVNMSGGIKVVVIYAKILADKGHQVTLISPPASVPTFTEKLKAWLRGRGWLKHEQQGSHLDGSGLDHRVLESFRPIMDQDIPDADVAIATWWETAEWLNALGPEKGTKVYFVQHHEVFDYLPYERCRATYRLPLHKIVIAKWLQDVMRDEYGDADVDLVPNSVDKLQFHAPSRTKQTRPTAGFLFSYADFKGVDITLQVIAKLKAAIPDLRIISFGSALPDGVAYWDEQIECHYSPLQENIRDLYAQCDVWITASRSEGFNLPAMEAMACRTPVVSTRTGWPAEAIIDGHNGFICGIDDIDELAAGAGKILSASATEWEDFSLNAYRTVEHSSWQESATLFEQALMRACERQKVGRT
jgi:glycosyltransferase involved in cell wall biosynthesis